MKQDDFEKSVEEKLSLMERADYVFPKRFSRGDYIAVCVVAGVCLAGMIAGIWM